MANELVATVPDLTGKLAIVTGAVSYTHLDVYKRQLGSYAPLVATGCMGGTAGGGKKGASVTPAAAALRPLRDNHLLNANVPTRPATNMPTKTHTKKPSAFG